MSESRAKGTIGGFLCEDEIGSGGMGVVLRAQQVNLQRPAALKRLRRELVCLPEWVERFWREARVAASIHHPNVVAIYDCFQRRGELYMAQEFVDGPNLREVLQRAETIPPPLAAWIALEIARGLEAIHARGAVHRDLKPGNVLLGRDGQVKLTDFGVAFAAAEPALTRTGTVLGTPAYMAPEQLQGERGDSRSDLFSFGVLLYEMLAGTRPFPDPEDEGSESLLTRMRRERYPPLRRRERGVPRKLGRLVRRCLRARPGRRPQTATEIRRFLERHFDPPASPELRAEIASWLWARGAVSAREGETVVRLAASPPGSKRSRSGKRLVAAAALLACGLALGATGMLQNSWTDWTAPLALQWGQR